MLGVACVSIGLDGGEQTEIRQGKKDGEKDNAETQRARRCAERGVDNPALLGMVKELEDGVGGAVDGTGRTETVADFGQIRAHGGSRCRVAQKL